MCGIAGKVSLDPARPVDQTLIARMIETLRHRGPDGGGVWASGGVGLGSRRLAVIDLSERGRQPMANEDASLQIVFNGEIYNFQEIRRELEARGHRFLSGTDTEVVLHAYEQYGCECLDHFRGMFAFAIWDAPRRRLFAARDRLGKKPLLYRPGHTAFLFASEARALLLDPQFPSEADPAAIHHYLTYGYVPSPLSALRGVAKLPPAHYLVLDDAGLRVERYWSLQYQPKRSGPESELGVELDALLEESVRLRLISDVPLGALLSGGVDSTAVVAYMRRASSGRIRTYSVGFDEPDYDELAYARQVARRFDTDHQELVVRPGAEEMLGRLIDAYSEPFADASAVPSLAVCAMARRSVTVALTGDGGDESFIGYDRYRGALLAERQDRLPASLRGVLARGARLLPAAASTKSTLARMRRFGESLALQPRRRYGRWITCFTEQEKQRLYTAAFATQIGTVDALEMLDEAYGRSDAPSFLEATVHADVQLYLPDDLLVKMDIASMANSLEVRSPLLDHRVVEFAASLPPRLKLAGRTSKYLLKRVLNGVAPAPVLRRAKMGFGVPVEQWLRTALKAAAYDSLLDRRARQRGYFDQREVKRLLDEHVSERANHHFKLWALLVLELWHRRYVDAGGTTP